MEPVQQIAEGWNLVAQVGVPILGALLLGNMLFLSRLLRDFDQMKKAVLESFPVYTNRVEALEKETHELALVVKDIGSIRERIAVLEFANKSKVSLQ